MLRANAAETDSPRTIFADSVVEVGQMPNTWRVVATSLSPTESAAPITISVSLKLRAFDELKRRIQGGEVISNNEIEAKYLPLASDYTSVREWLVSNGLTIAQDDHNHTVVFATGSVAQIAEAFDVRFVRAATIDGEFTCAASAPALPASISKNVLGVAGLQRPPRHHQERRLATAGGVGTSPNATLSPADVLRAYNGPPLLDGAGQTIAIIMYSDAVPSDLAQFWSECHVPQTVSNYSVVPVLGGPSDDQGAKNEATEDVAWSGSIAPSAKMVVYAGPDFIGSAVRILNDLPDNPSIHQVSLSLGAAEMDEGGAAALESYSQTFAQLVAAGVTVFSSSGDSGSNPDPASQIFGYNPAFPLSAEYPASDPFVVAVGGTSLTLAPDGSRGTETTWFSAEDHPSGYPAVSGGGISTIFARPSWQKGPGLPEGTTRCVPDVAAIADFAFIVSGGKDSSVWGTSVSSPIWAGTCALINQALAMRGKGPVGALGPQLYPLIGTSAFFDVTTGGNGAYNAGPGYDLCTGMGSPNISNLIDSILSSSIPVPFPIEVPKNPSGTTLTLEVASGNPFTISVPSPSDAASYEWTLETPSGSYTLVDGPNPILPGVDVSGSATSILRISHSLVGMSGYRFSCAVYLSPGYLDFDYLSASTLLEIKTPVSTFEGASILTGAPAAPATVGARTVLAATPVAALTYQWQLDGIDIPGANHATYIPGYLSNGTDSTSAVGAVDAGHYTVKLTDASGATGFLDADTLQVTENAWLINLSARASVSNGAGVLIGGFVTTGTSKKSVLLRAGGPFLGLPPFNLTPVLSAPHLDFYAGQTVLQSSDAWNSDLAKTMASVGAYPWVLGSADCAIVESVDLGAYTGIESSSNGTPGIGLIEVYDADAGAPDTRLANLSARANVAPGSSVLIGGFVVSGTTSMTVLIRAGGPTLGIGPFDVAGSLQSTVITLCDRTGAPIAANMGWSNGVTLGLSPLVTGNAGTLGLRPATSLDFERAGAFSFYPGSGDSALVATLPPGNYTAIVTGTNGTTGVAIVEIYDLR